MPDYRISNHFGNGLYRVADLQAAKHFYAKAFQVEPYFDEPTWVIFEIGEYQLWLVPKNSTEEYPVRVTRLPRLTDLLCWDVDDIETIYQNFIELGGKGLQPPSDSPIPDAVVEDLWGNKSALVRLPH